MKLKRKQIDSVIQESPPNCTVLVSAEFAHLFRLIPKDGRTYVVNDPNHRHVQHWTFPDGSYVRQDSKAHTQKGSAILFRSREKRTLYKDRKSIKQKTRIAEDVSTQKRVSRQSDEPPEICLIDIQRVMRIVGFRKSFIYEQADFPKPVRLGTSRRSAVRWIESEIVQWCFELAHKRSITTPTCSMAPKP